MKTKEQVINHLRNVGYGVDARNNICGFLFGVGLKNLDEKLVFLKGEKEFRDFVFWFNLEESDIQESIMTDLKARIAYETNPYRRSKLLQQIEYLQNKFKQQ